MPCALRCLSAEGNWAALCSRLWRRRGRSWPRWLTAARRSVVDRESLLIRRTPVPGKSKILNSCCSNRDGILSSVESCRLAKLGEEKLSVHNQVTRCHFGYWLLALRALLARLSAPPWWLLATAFGLLRADRTRRQTKPSN